LNVVILYNLGISKKHLNPASVTKGHLNSTSKTSFAINLHLIDFGLTRQCDPSSYMTTLCGSPPYTAPEIIEGQIYAESVDVWSAGILLYAMFHNRLPFYDENVHNLFNMIKNKPIQLNLTVPPDASDLILRMLDKDPQTRITIPEIVHHPFFSDDLNMTSIYYDPDLLPIDPSGVLDSDIADQLEQYGITSYELKNDIITHNFSHHSAMYRILRFEKINNLLVSKIECGIQPLESRLPRLTSRSMGSKELSSVRKNLPLFAQGSRQSFQLTNASAMQFEYDQKIPIPNRLSDGVRFSNPSGFKFRIRPKQIASTNISLGRTKDRLDFSVPTFVL